MRTKSEGGDDVAGAEDEEVDIDLGDPEVEKAAIKIQAGFKGFKARKEVQEKSSEQQEEDSGSNPPEPQQPSQPTSSAAGQTPSQPATSAAGQTPSQPATAASQGSRNDTADSGIADELADIDLKDPDLNKVTLKLQAGFRGFKSRKKATATGKEETSKTGTESPASVYSSSSGGGVCADRDGSGSRPSSGSTRNETPAATEAKPNNDADNDELKDIDLTDPGLGKAALMIQAGFRGKMSKFKKKSSTSSPSPETTTTPATTSNTSIKTTSSPTESNPKV